MSDFEKDPSLSLENDQIPKPENLIVQRSDGTLDEGWAGLEAGTATVIDGNYIGPFDRDVVIKAIEDDEGNHVDTLLKPVKNLDGLRADQEKLREEISRRIGETAVKEAVSREIDQQSEESADAKIETHNQEQVDVAHEDQPRNSQIDNIIEHAAERISLISERFAEDIDDQSAMINMKADELIRRLDEIQQSSSNSEHVRYMLNSLMDELDAFESRAPQVITEVSSQNSDSVFEASKDFKNSIDESISDTEESQPPTEDQGNMINDIDRGIARMNAIAEDSGQASYVRSIIDDMKRELVAAQHNPDLLRSVHYRLQEAVSSLRRVSFMLRDKSDELKSVGRSMGDVLAHIKDINSKN